MQYRIALVLSLVIACKSDNTAPPASSPSGDQPSASNEPAKPAKPAAEADLPAAQTPTVWAFKVNGAPAVTTRRKGDVDEPIMSIQLANNHGMFSVYGDVEGSPRRAFVTFNIDNFKPEPAEYKARARIDRYLDTSGGKTTGWHSAKDGATFKITSITEKEKNPVGTKWLASGTFEAKGLELDLGQQSETKTIDLTEGTFTDLEVQSLGKPRP